MSWWTDEEKEKVIQNGGLVRKDEWDRWSNEDKKRWFENVKKRSKKKKDKNGSGW